MIKRTILNQQIASHQNEMNDFSAIIFFHVAYVRILFCFFILCEIGLDHNYNPMSHISLSLKLVRIIFSEKKKERNSLTRKIKHFMT